MILYESFKLFHLFVDNLDYMIKKRVGNDTINLLVFKRFHFDRVG